MPQHTFPATIPINTLIQTLIPNPNPPMPVRIVRLLRLPSHAVTLQLLRHPVVHLPPPRVRHVARKLLQLRHVPVTVVVPETHPRLVPQVMQHVQHRRLRLEQPHLHLPRLRTVAGPEILEEVHAPRDAVPPREDLVQVALVAAVVRFDAVHVLHQEAEGAVRRLHHHHPGVEEGTVVARGGDLRRPEQKVDVAED
ncbi:hypothetical protein MIMGU_mgv1a014266mg [Erythranthe guttata]|uniref:Uncharacterized protein n=1 Tax=Erythranthe guttata TaxID=4155 RepID=A0A022Q866_ERYGU|nr:hypothetical protein MIMGU_mgv1a014266mg [Erythranthe guttata]